MYGYIASGGRRVRVLAWSGVHCRDLPLIRFVQVDEAVNFYSVKSTWLMVDLKPIQTRSLLFTSAGRWFTQSTLSEGPIGDNQPHHACDILLGPGIIKCYFSNNDVSQQQLVHWNSNQNIIITTEQFYSIYFKPAALTISLHALFFNYYDYY